MRWSIFHNKWRAMIFGDPGEWNRRSNVAAQNDIKSHMALNFLHPTQHNLLSLSFTHTRPRLPNNEQTKIMWLHSTQLFSIVCILELCTTLQLLFPMNTTIKIRGYILFCHTQMQCENFKNIINFNYIQRREARVIVHCNCYIPNIFNIEHILLLFFSLLSSATKSDSQTADEIQKHLLGFFGENTFQRDTMHAYEILAIVCQDEYEIRHENWDIFAWRNFTISKQCNEC